MATEPNSLPISAGETEVKQDNTNCQVSVRKELTQLILWHNWRKSILVFVILQALIYDLTSKSAISVVSVFGQIALGITIGYRVYVRCLQCLNRTQIQGNPYQKYLDMDISITPQQAQRLSCLISTKVNGFLSKLRAIAFMESPIESLKCMAILNVMSLVGHVFNVTTLLQLGLLLVFTVPKIIKWKQPLNDDRLGTLQKLVNYFWSGNSTETQTNSKTLKDLDDKTLDQQQTSDKMLDKKILINPPDTTRPSSDAEITEELCAGGGDPKTMPTSDEFEQIDESWKEDHTEYLNRKNL